METSLIIPTFIAGIATFLAPCTLPLLPVYLGLISGDKSELSPTAYRRKSILGSIFFILGFSLIFIIFGLFAGLIGQALGPGYRTVLTRLSGLVVIIFALMVLGVLDFPALGFRNLIERFNLQPGKPLTAFLLGVSIGIGWTPCIGPILGSVLTLAANQTDILGSLFLLTVFSLGLALPFIAIAFGASWILSFVRAKRRAFLVIYRVAGVMLLLIGVLLLTNNLGPVIQYSFRIFEFIDYNRILNLL